MQYANLADSPFPIDLESKPPVLGDQIDPAPCVAVIIAKRIQRDFSAIASNRIFHDKHVDSLNLALAWWPQPNRSCED